MEHGIASGVNFGTDIGVFGGDETNIVNGLANGLYNENLLNPQIVRDGLMLHLDAGNLMSYPRTGNIWRDLSGNQRDYTLFGGPSYTTHNGGGIQFDGSNDYAQGPPSNAFGLGTTYTLEFISMPIANAPQFAFAWYGSGATLQDGNRAIVCTLPWFGGTIFWDTNRRFQRSDSTLLNNISHFAFRLRDVSPFRAIFKNGVEVENSGAGDNPSFSYTTTRAEIGRLQTDYYTGTVYLVRLYNRGLSGEEILQNFNATRARFRL